MKRRDWLGFALVALVGIVFVLAWQFTVRGLAVPGYILPAPTDIVTAFMRGAGRGIYWPNLFATLSAMLIGYAIGAGAGIVLGALVAEFKLLERIIYPYVV